nr:uncharacterized protein LOC129275712 [Lytechinus pictus]
MHLSTQILVAIYGLLICFSQVQAAEVLESLAKLYIPYDYDGSRNGLYGTNKAAVEQSAYDEDARILYSAGDKYTHIIQLSTYLSILERFPLPAGRAANDIEICGDYIAYVIEGQTSQADGTLIVRGKYNINTKEWPVTSQIQVGSKPDMLKFNHLCTVIMTANEGEDWWADPTRTPSSTPKDQSPYNTRKGRATYDVTCSSTYTFLRPYGPFHNFTNSMSLRADKLERWGVRAPYKGYLSGDSYNTFFQNMEPEYISISKYDHTFYVCLQENNAIAVVNIEQRTTTDLIPLGTKSKFCSVEIFPENKKYDIFSFYQPDAIKVFSFNNTDYIFTANEGDRFEYELGSDDWDEGIRGKDLYDGDEGVELSEVKDQLKDNDELDEMNSSMSSVSSSVFLSPISTSTASMMTSDLETTMMGFLNGTEDYLNGTTSGYSESHYLTVLKIFQKWLLTVALVCIMLSMGAVITLNDFRETSIHIHDKDTSLSCWPNVGNVKFHLQSYEAKIPVCNTSLCRKTLKQKLVLRSPTNGPELECERGNVNVRSEMEFAGGLIQIG